MEGEAVRSAAASAPASAEDATYAAAPSPDGDLATLGSPEDRESSEPQTLSDGDDQDHEQALEHDQDVDHDSGTGALTVDDLKQRIIKQVEYYFSDENLPTDKYMLNIMKKNKEGFVPIGVIASFRKMKKLSGDHAFISDALKESAFLVVSPDGKKVKRLNPLPVVEVRDHKLCTVLVENLPEDRSLENLRKIFGEVGKVKKISIRNPNAAEETKKGNTTSYSSKPHALVEYEAAEAAEKAATTLNNEEDWRNSMRVKLLKRVGKYGHKRQVSAGSESDKKTVGHLSDHTGDDQNNSNEHHEDHEDTPAEEENTGDRGRNRGNYGRGRRHKQRGLSSYGHGTVAGPQVTEASKPPPGPKMPDGTRGFAMGRGRPLCSDQS